MAVRLAGEDEQLRAPEAGRGRRGRLQGPGEPFDGLLVRVVRERVLAGACGQRDSAVRVEQRERGQRVVCDHRGRCRRTRREHVQHLCVPAGAVARGHARVHRVANELMPELPPTRGGGIEHVRGSRLFEEIEQRLDVAAMGRAERDRVALGAHHRRGHERVRHRRREPPEPVPQQVGDPGGHGLGDRLKAPIGRLPRRNRSKQLADEQGVSTGAGQHKGDETLVRFRAGGPDEFHDVVVPEAGQLVHPRRSLHRLDRFVELRRSRLARADGSDDEERRVRHGRAQVTE